MKLKRSLALFLTLILIVPFYTVNALSDSTIGIIIDGHELPLSTAPIIDNNRTLVPLRGVFEELGATVDWNQTTEQAIIKTTDIEVLISPDQTSVLLNGVLTQLDTAPQNIDNRLMVPLRFVAEALGHQVSWRAETRDVLIETLSSTSPAANESLPFVGDRSSLESLLSYSHVLHNYVDLRFNTLELVEETVDVSNELKGEEMNEGLSSEAESDSAISSSDYSGTNNQVEGVDEGDLVKTDGQHIVYIQNNTVKLIDPNPQSPVTLSELYIPRGRGNVSQLYLNDNQLILLGTSYVQYGLPEVMLPDLEFSRPTTYYTSNTFLLVYDITDPSQPTLVMDMDYEGNYVSSRLIGNDFYMVTQKQLDYWSISTMTDYELLPKYADNLANTSTVIPFEALRYFPDYIAPSLMMTIGIDLESMVANEVEAYLGAAETVYATPTELYLGFTHYDYAQQLTTLIYTPDYNKSTVLYKFNLDDGLITYEKKGSVPGSVLNQFSLDAYNDHLRVATTTGDMWDESNLSRNNVYILDEGMEVVGALTDLAPGERIYSTRFYEDRIYMVTFKQVDPLFVIDASDPSSPSLLGYLKVPGFSSYMHLLDKNHLLGFGTDTYEENGMTRTGGIKLSLFDVTDPYNPVESQVEVLGSSGSYSEIQYDHKALMISLDKGIMGFPLSLASNTPYSTDFVGAYIYTISPNSFSYKGNVTHKSDTSYYDYSTSINRLLYIDDYLYSFSNDKMLISNLSTMDTLNELDFQSSPIYTLPIIEPMEE